MTNQLSPETLSIDMDEDHADMFLVAMSEYSQFPYSYLKEFDDAVRDQLTLSEKIEYCSCRGPGEVPFHVGGECIKCHKRVKQPSK